MLDASAVLAMMLGGAGADKIRDCLLDSQISAVNLSEVVAKLQERGVPDGVIQFSIDELGVGVLPFDQEQALIAGLMRSATKSFGLSLGDRACLAAAHHTDAIAITTDRLWRRLDVGVSIEVVR